MKQYQSTVEGTWYEIVKVELTQQQKQIIETRDPENADARKEVFDMIRELRQGDVPAEKLAQLQALYAEKKQVLEEGATYQLISIDASEATEAAFFGILNCRVNGEHVQVRF